MREGLEPGTDRSAGSCRARVRRSLPLVSPIVAGEISRRDPETPAPARRRRSPGQTLRTTVGLALGALLLAGCATRTGVVVATEDRAERYVGARSKGAGSDTVSLTSQTGADCGGSLKSTTEAGTRRPAAVGGVKCDDGKSGVLLFSDAKDDLEGRVSGVIDQKPVDGRWGKRITGIAEAGI